MRTRLLIVLGVIASIAAPGLTVAHAASKPKSGPPWWQTQQTNSRERQQKQGLDQITCPPPARPTCGANR